jgi:hypothetical protein
MRQNWQTQCQSMPATRSVMFNLIRALGYLRETLMKNVSFLTKTRFILIKQEHRVLKTSASRPLTILCNKMTSLCEAS